MGGSEREGGWEGQERGRRTCWKGTNTKERKGRKGREREGKKRKTRMEGNEAR